MLPKGLSVEVEWGSWPVLPVFEFLKTIGRIPDDDYRRSFNLGIGMIFAVGRKDAVDAERALKKLGEDPYRIGHVIEMPAGSTARVLYK
jgi:phosphoribosylformylglycinamidine cyclo-ligase